MRIAMIGQKAVPFYRDGGVETHVEALATRLAKRGHEVTVFVRRRYVATKDDIWQGVHLVRVPSVPTKHLDAITSTFFATIFSLCGRYDIIHFHGVGPALLTWIPRLFTRAKIVVTFHSIDRFHSKWGFFARFVLYYGEWAATHIPHITIAVSETIVQYCKKEFGVKVVYIPNGVEIRQVKEKYELRRFDLLPGQYLITVARLVHHKGLHHLIEAYKAIPNSVKGEMKLVIVGAPSFTSDYEDYLKELAGEDYRIVFAGYQTGATLAQLYAHSFMYVHPSEYEGLSLTILEAMSFGKCVLLSDIPENREIMDHSGIPFEVGSAEDLAGKLTSLINHPEVVRMRGHRALGFIKKNFEWEMIVKTTEEVYQRLK